MCNLWAPTIRPEESMRYMGPFVFLALSILPASAQPVKEFQSSQGVVKITFIADEPARKDSAVTAPLLTAPLLTAPKQFDSISDLVSLPELAGNTDMILEIYFLDRQTGNELRFPSRYSQLRRYLRWHSGVYTEGSVGDRAVAFIRDFSKDLRIRMKTAATGGGKP
jgi:hypothetical protein